MLSTVSVWRDHWPSQSLFRNGDNYTKEFSEEPFLVLQTLKMACNRISQEFLLEVTQLSNFRDLILCPRRAWSTSFLRFVDYSQWHIAFGRTPLEEGLVSRKRLYLTTHNTHNRHQCPRRDSYLNFKKASGHRPSPSTARPLEWALDQLYDYFRAILLYAVVLLLISLYF
jgi:hypothetical protein